MHTYTEKAFAFIVIIIKRSDLRQSCPQTEHSLSPPVDQEASPSTGYNLSQESQHHTSGCTTGHIKNQTLGCSMEPANSMHIGGKKHHFQKIFQNQSQMKKSLRLKCSEDTRNSQHRLHLGLRCRRRVMASQKEMFVFCSEGPREIKNVCSFSVRNGTKASQS